VNVPTGHPQLQLRDLYAIALYLSPDLDIARAHLHTTQTAIVTANTRPNPTVSIGGGWTKARESPVVFHFDPAMTVETGGKRALRALEASKTPKGRRRCTPRS
jgi:hypothetical protein